jgi:hypothetical protein
LVLEEGTSGALFKQSAIHHALPELQDRSDIGGSSSAPLGVHVLESTGIVTSLFPDEKVSSNKKEGTFLIV